MGKIYDYKGIKINWLGHSSFMIKSDVIIYIDPFKLSDNLEKADFILITHDHFDHLSIEDIKKIIKKDTVFVMPRICAEKVNFDAQINVIKPLQKIALGKIAVDTIPAYNLNKEYHPKANGYVGYVISTKGVRIFHAGDSDYIVEMNGLGSIDVALMPIGGTYTMNPKEAAAAVNSFKPRIAIPMHWGSIVGKASDAEEFRKNVKGPDVVILQ